MLKFFLKAWLQDESLYPELVNWFLQWAVSCRCNISSHRAFCPRLETSKTECLRHLNKQRTHQITKETIKKSMKNPLFTHLIQGLSRIKSHQNPDQKQGALWSSGWRPSQVSCHRYFSQQGLVAKTPVTVGFLPFGLRAIWKQTAVEIASQGVRTTTMIKQNEMKTQHAKHDTARRNLKCHWDFRIAKLKSSDYPLKRAHIEIK